MLQEIMTYVSETDFNENDLARLSDAVEYYC